MQILGNPWQTGHGAAPGTICNVHDDRASSLVEMTGKLSSIWPNLWPKMQFPLQYNEIISQLCKMCTSNGCLKWLQFWINQKEHFVPAFRGFFLPYMNIAESGQSRMRAQQQHGKMLLLVDGVYKDISKQLRMHAMYKATDRQEPIDTGKSLNLLDLQLYSRNEQEQCALILSKNLMHGNQ